MQTLLHNLSHSAPTHDCAAIVTLEENMRVRIYIKREEGSVS